MYKTIGQAIELANGVKRAVANERRLDIVLCPPYTALCEVSEVIMETNVALGAQDMHWEDEGAYTGEVSGAMLKDLSCDYVIIGHSERRQYFGETNETVNKKVKAALKHKLTPIVCVGEKLNERQAGKTFEVVEDHIVNGLDGLSGDQAASIVIAYEPVWAIGTGVNATPQQAQEVHKFIREKLAGIFGKDIADCIRIQYGGSVKPENIKDITKQQDVDGALVGGASLKVDSFVDIIKKGLEGKI